MRSSSAAITLALMIYSSVAQAKSPADQVRSAIADMNEAAAKLDADAFMRSYWQSPALAVTFDGATMRGWTTILSEQRKWWSDKQAGIKFEEQRPPEIVAQGTNIVTSIQWMHVMNAGSKKPAQLVITSVWKRRPEGWRVVLAHETLTP